ncbi:MAG: endonuclease MutS2 [Candidatus Acidiferrum sp.]
MSRTAEEILEFEKLRELLRGRSTCAPGKRAVDALAFSQDRERLQRDFALIHEAREWLRVGKDLGFGSLADPQGWLAKIEGSGTVLEVAEFLDAASLLDTASWLRQQFRESEDKFPLLAARAESVIDFRDVLGLIRKAILPTGEISDDASPELRKIRANILQTRDSIQKSLKQILRARNAEAGEDYVTLRNDRFVIPVRSEHRRGVQGIVHGASGTGQTVFVEPFETVESNNQLVQFSEEEAAEIFRILRGLTERLRMVRGPLDAAVQTIAELDSVFARARYAKDFDATIPEFSGNATLEFVALRHPVLEDKLRKENRPIVPMTLALGGDQKLLVISGPNTGGKTVALKSTGMAALSAQCGIPIAAQKAVLPLFDHVLVDIGDEQSIAADLSTFSSHMLNLKSILESATPDSLVLVDEMGTGTAPEEGAALAVALLDELHAKNCFVLATTHHDRLKTYAASSPGVVNAAVEFDEVNLRPTYRLTVGVPGVSSGIAIAQRLGLTPRIIERARQLMDPEALEAGDLIAYLHRTRDELDRMQAQMTEERHALEKERKKLQTEWLGRQQKRIAELEAQFTEMQKRFEQNVASVVEAVKDRELRAQLEKTSRRKLQEVRGSAKEDLNAAIVQTISESQSDLGVTSAELQPVAIDNLQPGAKIRLRGFAKPVIFRRRDGNSAEVEAGPLRMKVALDEITAVEAAASKSSNVAPGFGPASSRATVTVKSAPRESSAATEINVIGMTVEQATDLVDKFLDDAALAHLPQVRIIHGHGTGALRKGLAEYLKTQPLVAKASFESEEHGGKAITVVELRS